MRTGLQHCLRALGDGSGRTRRGFRTCRHANVRKPTRLGFRASCRRSCLSSSPLGSPATLRTLSTTSEHALVAVCNILTVSRVSVCSGFYPISFCVSMSRLHPRRDYSRYIERCSVPSIGSTCRRDGGSYGQFCTAHLHKS